MLEPGDSVDGAGCGTLKSGILASIGLVTGEEFPESLPVPTPNQNSERTKKGKGVHTL